MRILMIWQIIWWLLLLPDKSSAQAAAANADSIQQWLKVLASDSLKGRGNFRPELQKAALYIRQSFVASGIKPFFTDNQYLQFFATRPLRAALLDSARDTVYDPTRMLANVLGVLPGRSKQDEVVIFSAHYDHVGTLRARGDSIYNGANDNASGVAALMAIAQVLGKQGTNERTIFFCAFAGEELGLVGSTFFAGGVDPKKVVAVVNLEMLGRTGGVGKNSFFITGSRYSGMEGIFRRRLEKEKVKLRSERYGPAGDLFQRSDNYPFAQLGIAAHTVISSTDADPCYHRACDEWRSINFDHLTNVVNALLVATATLVDGTERP